MAGTVLVGCKIPSGLVLQLRNELGDVVKEQVLQGAQMAHLSVAVAAPNALREHGVGMTTVDKDLWDAWEEWAMKNRFEPYVQGFVFADAKRENVLSEAKDRVRDKSQLEGLAPGDASDPRVFEFRNVEKEVA